MNGNFIQRRKGDRRIYMWKKKHTLLIYTFFLKSYSQEICSVQFSHSVMSDSLGPQELQNARPPCPSPTPGVHSNSRPSSQWCHPAISSSVVHFSPSPIPPSNRDFSNESTLRIRWPKYWIFSFSISPSNEYSGLISFRMDWLDFLAVQGTLESSPAPQFKSINSMALSFL